MNANIGTIACIAISILAIGALSWFSIASSHNQSQVGVLSMDSDERCYAGSLRRVAINFSSSGFSKTPSIRVAGSGAYEVLVAILYGKYDERIHKWVLIGGASTTLARNWTGPLYWESYYFKLLSYTPCTTRINVTKFGAVAYCRVRAVYLVTHCVFWILCSSHVDVLKASPKAVIPLDALNETIVVVQERLASRGQGA